MSSIAKSMNEHGIAAYAAQLRQLRELNDMHKSDFYGFSLLAVTSTLHFCKPGNYFEVFKDSSFKMCFSNDNSCFRLYSLFYKCVDFIQFRRFGHWMRPS